MLFSLTEENRHLPKQIGCIHGVFRLFGRRHFIAARNMSGHYPFPGVQQQMEPQNARKAVIEKDLEAHKMKPGASSDSSQPSTSYSSSSSSSSTLTSLNSSRQPNTPKSPLQITSIKETKGPQSPDVRGVVKDTTYIEARCVPIKNLPNDDRKVKHIDSPRPAQQSKFRKPKASLCEGIKDVRLALPRSSYDGRESRDRVKTNMKINELPRFSLDSKASSLKISGLNSRLNFLGRDESENSSRVPPVNQESVSHSRSNSIVAKLMGLEAFPDSITTEESLITKTNSSPSPKETSTTAEARKQKQIPSSPPVSQNPASTSPRSRNDNYLRKQSTCLRLPVEAAPWKQQNFSRGSPKIAAQSGKALENRPHPSLVYGEIEKRIAELEFKRSGKDLRALKQILEAMQKTRGRLQTQKGESAEPRMQQRSNLGMETPHLQKLKTQDPKYHRESAAQNEKSGYGKPRNNMKEANWCFPSIEKKITCRNFVEQTLGAPQPIQVENNTTPTPGLKMVAPRVRYNVVKTERESHPNKLTSESGMIKKQTSKKVREKCPQKRKHIVKSTDSQSGDGRLSSHSSETRYSTYYGDTASTKSESNSSIASHIETEVISLTTSISTNPREQQDYASISKEHMPEVKLTVATMEQPSPVSVLDTPFYDEGSPSPVKKISTAFQDESSSSDEAEQQLENPNHLTDCTKRESGYKYNQKSENQLYFIHEPKFLKSEADETATEGLMKEAIGELIEKNDQMTLNQKNQGKIVSDLINEIMARKITSDGLFNLGWKRTSLQGLIKEAYLEMDHLCRLPYCNLDDGDGDGSIRLITADMKWQSDDWKDYSREVPGLVLDIERLIFKDLINEIVTCEVGGLHDRSTRHCRQLFNKQYFCQPLPYIL